MNRILGLALLGIATFVVARTGDRPPRLQIDQEHTKWIDSALRSMQTVRVGGTRSELLKIFTTEGGLSTPSRQTYIYRHCPYIKVDVQFAAGNEELPTDKVVDISRPYLDWSIAD
jgi:hypothetical protein